LCLCAGCGVEMLRSDEHWLSLIDSFQAAALGGQSWDSALEGLAAATGSRCGQLIGREADLTILFNIMTNLDPAVQKLVYDYHSVNPRTRAIREAPILKPLADWDIITPEESRRSVFYEEVVRPKGFPFICTTALEKEGGRFIALAVIRADADGYITAEQRHTFSSLAPHVRAAVRMHVALERNGAAVLAGAMEALSIPVFVGDHLGRVRMLTRAAEELVAAGTSLRLKNARLHAWLPSESNALNDAIDAAAFAPGKPGPPVSRTIIVHAKEAAPLVLDIFALPTRCGGLSLPNMTARVLVVVRGPRGTDTRRAAVLSALYGLTAAETEIAQHLTEGKSAQDIAAHRGVAVGTVRAQIKTILAKAGVSRQIELVSRLNQLQ
jgi:DNA-binding CsgD family transcriptional regulator